MILLRPVALRGAGRRVGRVRAGDAQLAGVHAPPDVAAAGRPGDAFRGHSDHVAAGVERSGHRRLVDAAGEAGDDGPPLPHGQLGRRGGRCAAGRLPASPRAGDAESRPAEPLDRPGDEQERRTCHTQPRSQRRREPVVERGHERDAVVVEPFLFERQRRRRIEELPHAYGFVEVDARALGDGVDVVVEQVGEIDPFDELPELAGGERVGVERARAGW